VTINEFWGPYNLKIPYAIEHKEQNIYTLIAYFRKGDYALKTISGKIVYKIRTISINNIIGDISQAGWVKLVTKTFFPEKQLNFDSLFHFENSISRISNWLLDKKKIQPGTKMETKKKFTYKSTEFPYKNVKEWKNKKLEDKAEFFLNNPNFLEVIESEKKDFLQKK
jgi:hypothetical protein